MSLNRNQIGDDDDDNSGFAEHNDNNQIEDNINRSILRRDNLTREFVAYQFEFETGRQAAVMRKKAQEITAAEDLAARSSGKLCKDCDEVFVNNSTVSVGSTIKTKAVKLRADYHKLSFNDKAVVSLGLNSIVDLSFTYPYSQSTILQANSGMS